MIYWAKYSRVFVLENRGLFISGPSKSVRATYSPSISGPRKNVRATYNNSINGPYKMPPTQLCFSFLRDLDDDEKTHPLL